MGLDVMDVAYRIEKAFDIELSSEDFTSLASDGDITAGALYDLVLKRMHLRDFGRYDIGLNLELWRQLRLMLHTVTEVSIDRITLATPLDILFPKASRREMWDAVRETTPYQVRELEYPGIVRIIGAGLAAVMVVIEQLHIWQMPWVKWVWPLLALFGLWMFVETYVKVLAICAPLRTCFPAGMMTVKDFCRAVLATNYADICSNLEMPVADRSPVVWEQLRMILVDTLGVDADEITFRSRLIRDLGMA